MQESILIPFPEPIPISESIPASESATELIPNTELESGRSLCTAGHKCNGESSYFSLVLPTRTRSPGDKIYSPGSFKIKNMPKDENSQWKIQFSISSFGCHSTYMNRFEFLAATVCSIVLPQTYLRPMVFVVRTRTQTNRGKIATSQREKAKQKASGCYLCFASGPLITSSLQLGTTRTHRISPMTIVMIIDWKCHDQVTDQELVAHNVTKHVLVATTVRVSPLIITVELVTLTLLCFSRNLSWLCQWHFAKLIIVKKKSWYSDWPRVGRKNVTKHALVTPNILSIISDYHYWVRDADMDLVQSDFFFFWHWQWHFAALYATMKLTLKKQKKKKRTWISILFGSKKHLRLLQYS